MFQGVITIPHRDKLNESEVGTCKTTAGDVHHSRLFLMVLMSMDVNAGRPD